MNVKITDGFVYQIITRHEAIALFGFESPTEVCCLFPDGSETEMESLEQIDEYNSTDVEWGISVGHLSDMVKLATQGEE